MQNGETPLSAAAYRGRLEVARLLLEKGADVDRADNVRRRGARGEVDVSREDVYVYLCIYQICTFMKVC